MSDEIVNLKVPRQLAEKLNERAKRKDRLRNWASEAREILEHAVAEEAT
jgi:hypothetical protein